jgi:hypothetical protein
VQRSGKLTKLCRVKKQKKNSHNRIQAYVKEPAAFQAASYRVGRSRGPRLWEISAALSWWMHGRPWSEDYPHAHLPSLERPPCAIIGSSVNMVRFNGCESLCRRWESTAGYVAELTVCNSPFARRRHLTLF